MRRRFLKGMLGCLLCLMGNLPAAEPPLRLAVHPYASTLALITTHRPLIVYLSNSLGRPVEFYTAANFDAFVDSLLAGDYDIAIAPPHFGALAIAEQYWPVLHYQVRLEPLLVVRNDSPFTKAEDFRGKRIAMADRSALIRLVASKWLADQGLQAERDYRIVERPSHAAAIGSALAGEAEAGLSTNTALRQMPENVRKLVRGIPAGPSFPHLFTLINRRHGDAMRQRLKAALLDFQASPEGQKFLSDAGFMGYDEISESDVKAVRPYAEAYRRSMQQGDR